jgi:hypothetical protein
MLMMMITVIRNDFHLLSPYSEIELYILLMYCCNDIKKLLLLSLFRGGNKKALILFIWNWVLSRSFRPFLYFPQDPFYLEGHFLLNLCTFCFYWLSTLLWFRIFDLYSCVFYFLTKSSSMWENAFCFFYILLRLSSIVLYLE